MPSWIELADDEYDHVWDCFYADFKFKPDYHERSSPAILEPSPSVTFDLSDIPTDATIGEIDAILFDAFRSTSSTNHTMYALDWQHTCYKFDPHIENVNPPIRWFPDGDYYIFLADDFSFGTFGHPWQCSLCVFGGALLEHVEKMIRNRLTVVRESRLRANGG